MPFEVKFGNVKLTGVSSVTYNTSRNPNRDGDLAQNGFGIELIHIEREIRPDPNNGSVENDIIKLASAVGRDAYFRGEIKVIHPTNLENPVKTVRWERGHICQYGNMVSGGEGEMTIRQSLAVSVTGELVENDGKFPPANAIAR